MNITINGIGFPAQEGISIMDALKAHGVLPAQPSLGDARHFIHNDRCPLLGLAEIDGRLVPLPFLESQRVREGMKVVTDSPRVCEEALRRGELLLKSHECFFMKEWQRMVVADAENAGFITVKDWERQSFEPRGARPSIHHDPNKCVRCKACIDTCQNQQGVGALSYDDELGVIVDEKLCVRCGQCIHRCPMGARASFPAVTDWFGCDDCAFAQPLGAMREVEDTFRVWALLHDVSNYCVVQFAPAVRASLGEEFGFTDGELVTGKLYAALRRLGFKQVWDTNFAADLTIMEEGTELISRIQNSGRLPMFTSCSPGWIRFAETFYPSLLPHLSTAKSPQQMFGATAKTYGAQTLGIEPDRMKVISIMPCTAKKSEAAREEMKSASTYWAHEGRSGGEYPDVDLVLTTRELARLLKIAGIDMRSLPEEQADSLLGVYTGAAPIFGRTGGVMEAALRTAITILSGAPPHPLEFKPLEGEDGIKRAEVTVNGMTVRTAVAHGLDNARVVCESVLSGGEFAGYHFIEIMACPGGCIGGGGQPIPTNAASKRARTSGLNRDDREVCALRMSHENPEVKALYERFLERPAGHLSHELLHTHYTARPPA